MPFDTSLYQIFQPTKLADPLALAAQFQNLRAQRESADALAEQRRALADQRRFELEKDRREQAQAEALRNLTEFSPESIFRIMGPDKGSAILKGLADFKTADLATADKARDSFLARIGGIKALPAPLRPEWYQAAVDDYAQRGLLDPKRIPPYSPEALDAFERELLTPEQRDAIDHPKPIEVNGSLVEAKRGETPKTIYTAPETPAQKAAREAQAAQLSETSRHNRTTEGQAGARLAFDKSQALAAGAGANSPMTAEGLDVAASQYMQTGTLPPLGMGKAAADARMKIINRAGELVKAGAGDPMLNAALYKADSAALRQQTTTLSAITAFEETAKKNLEVMEREAAKIVDTGMPWINKPLRALGAQAGSPQLAAFNTARAAVVPEIARILTNPSLSGVLSDSARGEVNELLQGDASMAQMLASIRILRSDMDTRKKSLEDEVKALQSRMTSRNPGASTGRGAAPAPAVGDVPEAVKQGLASLPDGDYRASDGTEWTKRGGVIRRRQ